MDKSVVKFKKKQKLNLETFSLKIGFVQEGFGKYRYFFIDY